MQRTVPLNVFLFVSLLLLLAAVGFGYVVKTSAANEHGAGKLGKAAVSIASFPGTTATVFSEISSYASGDYVDSERRIPRPEHIDLRSFEPLRSAQGTHVEGLWVRAKPERLTRGWRVLVGAFVLDGELHNAAILISPQLEAVHSWVLDEISTGDTEPRPSYRKFPHGVAVLEDGSLVYGFDGGTSLQRKDRCGNRLWSTPGKFHHAVTATHDEESVWSLLNDNGLAQVSAADGSIIRVVTMQQIIEANPDIDILELRMLHENEPATNSTNSDGKWLPERFHLNDVDPLPKHLAEKFPGFEAGDLLVSSRSLNLVFVVNPDTLNVKWWRIGAFQRQHDPDWLHTGEIMVFNNRMSRDFSTIVAINPSTYGMRTLVDGRDNGFYTRVRGKSQLLHDGTVVASSPQQGRAFEINRDGEMVLEIVNTKPGSPDTNYVISELQWLPEDSFNLGEETCVKIN